MFSSCFRAIQSGLLVGDTLSAQAEIMAAGLRSLQSEADKLLYDEDVFVDYGADEDESEDDNE